jgi:hypothetical protein
VRRRPAAISVPRPWSRRPKNCAGRLDLEVSLARGEVSQGGGIYAGVRDGPSRRVSPLSATLLLMAHSDDSDSAMILLRIFEAIEGIPV